MIKRNLSLTRLAGAAEDLGQPSVPRRRSPVTKGSPASTGSGRLSDLPLLTVGLAPSSRSPVGSPHSRSRRWAFVRISLSVGVFFCLVAGLERHLCWWIYDLNIYPDAIVLYIHISMTHSV